MTNVFYAIRATWVAPVTMGDANEIIDDGLVIWSLETGRIVRVCVYDPLFVPKGSDFVYLKNHLLIPGLINCHTHSGMSLLRGFGDDMSLHEWLRECIFPIESEFLPRSDFIETGTKLSIFEMLKTGTTMFVDSYYSSEIAARVAHDSGIRIACGDTILDFQNGTLSGQIERAFEVCTETTNQYDSDKVLSILNPHACYTLPVEALESVAAIAIPSGTRVHIHLHESLEECVRFEDSHCGRSAMELLQDVGLLNERLIAAHCVCVSEAERLLLAGAKVNVVHCPKSNLKLASGVCPVQALISLGVNVALGTDGAASNNSLSMISEMTTAALIGKTVHGTSGTFTCQDDLSPISKSTCGMGDATAVTCHTVLRMATYNGAIAVGMVDKIGSIEVGKFADIVAIDLSSPECLPVFDPISALIYSTGAVVSHVWIGGKIRVREQQVLTVDLNYELISKFTQELTLFRKTHV